MSQQNFRKNNIQPRSPSVASKPPPAFIPVSSIISDFRRETKVEIYLCACLVEAYPHS